MSDITSLSKSFIKPKKSLQVFEFMKGEKVLVRKILINKCIT